jgi:hypothetical protein
VQLASELSELCDVTSQKNRNSTVRRSYNSTHIGLFKQVYYSVDSSFTEQWSIPVISITAKMNVVDTKIWKKILGFSTLSQPLYKRFLYCVQKHLKNLQISPFSSWFSYSLTPPPPVVVSL